LKRVQKEPMIVAVNCAVDDHAAIEPDRSVHPLASANVALSMGGYGGLASGEIRDPHRCKIDSHSSRAALAGACAAACPTRKFALRLAPLSSPLRFKRSMSGGR
jgi:hypothetical protein